MEYIKLKDLCEKEERFVAPNDDAHIDYVDISSVDNKSKSLTKYDTYIFAETPSRARKRVKHGDVIVSTVRPNLNAVARFNIQTPHTPIASTGFCVLRHKSDVDPIYIYFFCISPNFVRQMVAKATGASYPAVSDTIVREAKLPKHTAEKRVRIVSTLSKAKEIIEHRRAQLAKLDELVKCRFVEMFGDPIQNKQIYKLHSFTEFAYIDAEMTTDYHKYANYPHIGIDSIEKETGRLIGYRTVAQDGVISGKYLFSPEHLIYSKIRPNLNKVACPDFHGVCSADSYPIRNKSNCNKYYLLYVLRSQWFLDYIVPLSSRTNLPKVNRKQIESFTWPLPPIELQNQFEAFVRHIDKLRIVIRQSLDETQKLFDSLMQEYFD